MSNKKIQPENFLEKAIIAKRNDFIMDAVSFGAQLTRPDILAAKEAFELRLAVTSLLLESAPCLRSEAAVKRLEELNANPEMVDLVRELTEELPANTHPQSAELIDALACGDVVTVCNLVINDGVVLNSAPLEIFENLDEFPEFAIIELFDNALGYRLKSQLFLYLRDLAKDGTSPAAELHFEVLKVIIAHTENNERSNRIHEIWKCMTATAFTQTVTQNPEIFSEEFLADEIMDQELDFSVRAFKSFSPYYQALMLNNGGVGIIQFEEEAEIEKFDAKAVFELLLLDSEYANRVNWEYVNKTAKASEYLKFLSSCPEYSEFADWQMLNVQADAEDWLDFLETQPQMLKHCTDSTALYLCDPERWQKILNSFSDEFKDKYAVLYKGESDMEYCQLLKVRISGGDVEFYEVSDLGMYEELCELAQEDFQKFTEFMHSGSENICCVNVTR